MFAKDTLDMISEEKGIWYQGDEKSLNEKITLYFVNLTLYDGLRKILSKTNYALVYDIKKEIVGIFITSKSASIENVLKRDIQYTGSNFPRLDNETEEVSKIIHSEEINLEEKREIVVDKVNQTEKTANSELSIRPDDYEGE
ncbi:MAG: hypothetical protein HGJ94_13490 [Desulfosarcina sp.]|nr:hypothetical protein [Desulfosarcina sp.]